ncbi:Slc7a10 [Columba guinea]|nr:Slc7a10 [Columba guinea]
MRAGRQRVRAAWAAMAGGEQRGAPGGPGRVALKKEIGLVSACAIIIEKPGSQVLMGYTCILVLRRFLLLWSAVLIMYPTSLAVISLTFSNYVLQPVFPNCIPPYNASRILSMVCLLLLTWVNSSSVRWATRIQDIFTAGKLLALTLIIIVGFIQIFKGNYEELIPSNAFNFWMTPSVGHLALAFLQGSFAFSGWNFLNYVTEELVDPRRQTRFTAWDGPRQPPGQQDPVPFQSRQRNLPRAIFISIPLVTFVYTFTNIAYFTAMSPQELLSSNAVAVTFGEKLLGYFSWVMPVSVALSTFGGINGYLFTSSRLCFSGAREGHLPSLLAMIHVKHCTPIPALLVCCFATLVIMLVGDTYTLINYVSFINYLCYGVTIIGLLVLRWKKPKIFRPIKVNLLVPITYLAFWAFLLIFSLYSEPVVCGVGLIIILTGVPVFFLGVYWRNKPKCVNRLIESVTCWGQKLCFVVYPQGGVAEEDEAPSAASQRPMSKTTTRK